MMAGHFGKWNALHTTVQRALCIGKGGEYRPFCDFRPVPSAYLLVELYFKKVLISIILCSSWGITLHIYQIPLTMYWSWWCRRVFQ
jgi:hypothetical protein